MQWNDHSRDIPAGAHALFGASNYAWLKYDPEKAIRFYNAILARKKGVELHDTARRCIDNGLQLKGRNYLSKYVNDAIGYRMRTEQPLKFTNNFFGTSDAIIFFSQSYSYRMTIQAAGRIDRLNTPYVDLYYYKLRSSAPIDLAINHALSEKRDFNQKAFIKS